MKLLDNPHNYPEMDTKKLFTIPGGLYYGARRRFTLRTVINVYKYTDPNLIHSFRGKSREELMAYKSRVLGHIAVIENNRAKEFYSYENKYDYGAVGLYMLAGHIIGYTLGFLAVGVFLLYYIIAALKGG